MMRISVAVTLSLLSLPILGGPLSVISAFYEELPLGLQAELGVENKLQNFSSKKELLRFLLESYEERHNVGAKKSWRKLSGWQAMQLFRPSTWDGEADNRDLRGYASKEGMQSSRLDFISFGMLYFLTPETQVEDSIKCRTPEKFGYFRRMFPKYISMLDRRSIRCRPVGEGFLDDLLFYDPMLNKPIAMGPVDAAHVVGFELLYATPGTGDAAELAGHLLLRIKLNNNPDAIILGVENPHDLVIAFLANTVQPEVDSKPIVCRNNWVGSGQDLNFDPIAETVQALKGLSGGLLTVLDRSTLGQTLRSYTYFQDRNLLRYRLNLSDKQKEQLIQHLFQVKKNFATRYYFFDQNCASVLVKVIGQGIEDGDLAGLSTPLLPPHSLIGEMARKGLITQIFPSFYSYRRKGQGAKNRMVKLLNQLPTGGFDAKSLFNTDDSSRAQAYAELGYYVEKNQGYDPEIYRLLAYGQIAELAYQDIEDPCENYTSESLAEIRKIAKMILLRAQQGDGLVVNAEKRVSSSLEGIEKDARRGSVHTGLMTADFGVLGSSRYGSGLALSGAFFRQEIGSASQFAMQRAAGVSLGEASLLFHRDEQRIGGYRLTLLEVEKFRETLNTVPSVFADPLQVGLALGLLEYERDVRRDFSRLSLGKIGGLVNFWAGPQFENHLYLSLGVSAFRDSRHGVRSNHLGIPWKLAALKTLDLQRVWQLRLSIAGLAYLQDSLSSSEVIGKMKLTKRFTWSRDTEGLINLEIQRKVYSDFDTSESQFVLGVGYRLH